MTASRGVIAIDETNGTKAYARACEASSDYVLVRVPFDPKTGVEDHSTLTEDEVRFVVEDVTPKEWLAANPVEELEEAEENP